MKKFKIFAVAALGKGLSGGDRIFIEFAKRLSRTYQVTIYVWEEGLEMCKRQDLNEGVTFKVIKMGLWCKLGFMVCYFIRIIKSVFLALFMDLNNPNEVIIYSASEFWMDSLPGFFLKLRFPETKWVIGAFQAAPNPLKGFTQGARENTYKFSAFANWFVQLPIKPLIKKWADLVLVNNESERKHFKNLDQQNKVLVILGAVNTQEINNFIKINKPTKIYDAVYQGRFHPQKGVEELIDIWKIVIEKNPDAKLAMIGDGPLMNDVKQKVKQLNLEENIQLFGYIFDGPLKYKVFAQSKLVVHPAFYDSGGMAAAEAMAFGLPCVGFDLESYKSYYPQVMVKVEIGNLNKFADAILDLLKSKDKRDQVGKKGQQMINNSWSWDQRVGQLLDAIHKMD